MPTLHEPKLIAGNANLPLAETIARRMSLHRGVDQGLVDARVERFSDGEIFVEVFENVRGEDMFIIQPTSNPAKSEGDHPPKEWPMISRGSVNCNNACSVTALTASPVPSRSRSARGTTCSGAISVA